MKKLFLLLILLTACQKNQFQSLLLDLPSATSEDDQNSEDPQNPCDPRPFFAARINQLNTQYPTPTFTSLQPQGKMNPTEFPNLLKKNSELILVLDSACATKIKLPFPFDQINVPNTLSTEQSVLLKLPQDFYFQKLHQLAQAQACIKMISPNLDLHLTSSSSTMNDEFFPLMNYSRDIKHPETLSTFTIPSLHPPIRVAVIDTGVSYGHPDMTGRFAENAVEAQGAAGVDDDYNGYVDDVRGWSYTSNSDDASETYWAFPHGQHVSGLIAANTNNSIGVAGIASNRVQIMPLNVFNNSTPGQSDPTSPLIYMEQALRYAADNGAKVVNLSLGRTGKVSSMLEALKYAVKKNMVIIASAGNQNKEIGPVDNYFFAPAYYALELPGMLAVAATDSNPHLGPTQLSGKCDFSNFSIKYVDIAAPGCDTDPAQESNGLISTGYYTANNDPAQHYVRLSGTSMSGPLVAGAAALIISYIYDHAKVFPTNTLVEKILHEGSRRQNNLAAVVKDGQHLDLAVLLNYLNESILNKSQSCSAIRR